VRLGLGLVALEGHGRADRHAAAALLGLEAGARVLEDLDGGVESGPGDVRNTLGVRCATDVVNLLTLPQMKVPEMKAMMNQRRRNE